MVDLAVLARRPLSHSGALCDMQDVEQPMHANDCHGVNCAVLIQCLSQNNLR